MNWYENDNNRIILADVITKVLRNLQSKEDFVANPKQVLQEAGINDIPEEIELKVIENTSERQYIVLPMEFSTEEFDDFTASIQSSLPLPTGQEMVVVQNTANLQYVFIPELREHGNDSLSEEQLELVSGGNAAKKLGDIAKSFVTKSQVIVSVQAIAAVNAAVVAKTKTLIRG